MKRPLIILVSIFVLVLIILFNNCSIYKKSYSNYDKSIDFNKFETFAWLPDSGVVVKSDNENKLYDDDIIRNNTKNYVSHCFSAKGLKITTDTPDVLLQLVLLNEKKERIVTYPIYPYDYYYYNRFYYPYYYPYYRDYTFYDWGYQNFYFDGGISAYKQHYLKGTVTINMFERTTKQLIWTASAEGNIYDPEYTSHDIHPAVRKIINTYPVNKGSSCPPMQKSKELVKN